MLIPDPPGSFVLSNILYRCGIGPAVSVLSIGPASPELYSLTEIFKPMIRHKQHDTADQPKPPMTSPAICQ